MNVRILRIVSLLGLLVLPARMADADSAKPAPVHLGPKISIQGYGRQNPECRAWTDGCVLCTADETGQSRCSTPGIACQPHGLTCKTMVRPK